MARRTAFPCYKVWHVARWTAFTCYNGIWHDEQLLLVTRYGTWHDEQPLLVTRYGTWHDEQPLLVTRHGTWHKEQPFLVTMLQCNLAHLRWRSGGWHWCRAKRDPAQMAKEGALPIRGEGVAHRKHTAWVLLIAFAYSVPKWLFLRKFCGSCFNVRSNFYSDSFLSRALWRNYAQNQPARVCACR